MNEQDFRSLWDKEKPIYSAWGLFIIEQIKSSLEEQGKDLKTFLKIDPKEPRLKSDESILDKAFHRPEKSYQDPYNQIEDKVGIRFVVLLTEDIDFICETIQRNSSWKFDNCKHFAQEKISEPLLFSYQSVHYVLRPAEDFIYNDVKIPSNTPCEVQIRTLLQHAHAELTHDSIYKAQKKVHPEVHRTVAKSMALIETTDEFFSQATKKLNYGPLQEHGIAEGLDSLFFKNTQLKPISQRSSLVVYDAFEQFLDDSTLGSVSDFLERNSFIFDKIKDRYFSEVFFKQSVVLFVYWMMRNKKRRLNQDWPLSRSLLENVANDLGVSID